MKKLLLLLLLPVAVFAQSHKPVNIIFDTDIAPDYDDVGAIALLHAFADRGEATILATISCNAFKTTAPTLSVLNTYFNRPGIPVGITKRSLPDKDCSQQWAQVILAKYPHAIQSNSDAEEAVALYRKILSAQPDSLKFKIFSKIRKELSAATAFFCSFDRINFQPAMNTATNIVFTLLIKINGRQREFNFRKRPDANYDTDTNDEHGNRYIFRMEKSNDIWKIVGKSLPAWLMDSEGLIHDALQKNG